MFLKNLMNKFVGTNKDKIECTEFSDPAKHVIVTSQSNVDELKEEIDRLNKERLKLKKKKQLTLTDALVEVLGESNREMNVAQILQVLRNKNLKTKKLKTSSVRATLYYLINQNKIRYGLQRGTFVYVVEILHGIHGKL